MNIFAVEVDEHFVERVNTVLSWPNNEEFADLSQSA